MYMFIYVYIYIFWGIWSHLQAISGLENVPGTHTVPGTEFRVSSMQGSCHTSCALYIAIQIIFLNIFAYSKERKGMLTVLILRLGFLISSVT